MNREEKLDWDREEFERIHDEIKDKDALSHYEFLRIRNFKLQNSTTENEEKINRITKKAFKLAEKGENIKEAIGTLSEGLNGVGVPIASTILAMKFPNLFCIIDWRVIEELGKKEEFKDYLTSPEIYEKYLMLMRKEAKSQDIKLRDFERQLFEKSVRKV
jgi:hypothetical protein